MPAAYKRCVKKVGRKKGIRSAHAICTASNAGKIREYRRAKKSLKQKVKK